MCTRALASRPNVGADILGVAVQVHGLPQLDSAGRISRRSQVFMLQPFVFTTRTQATHCTLCAATPVTASFREPFVVSADTTKL